MAGGKLVKELVPQVTHLVGTDPMPSTPKVVEALPRRPLPFPPFLPPTALCYLSYLKPFAAKSLW